MKKVLRISLLVVISGVFFYTLYFLYQKSQTKEEVFETQQAEITDIVMKTVATGSVIPRKEIEIKPQVSGIVDKIYVQPGDRVRKGDLIAKVKIIPDMLNLNNAESRLEKAKINFDDAKQVFDRQNTLFKDGVIAEAEFLQSKMAYNNAKAELNAAENNLQLIQEGATKKSGQTTNTLIRATAEGMLLDVPVEEGNSVIESNTFNAGTTIAIIADMGDMIFEGKVDETEVGKIREGMQLELTIGAIEDYKFTAILEYISPKGVEENGAIQFEIRANVHQVDTMFIRAGYSANANIVLDRRDSVLALEERLITFENDSAFVEIQQADNQFKRIPIKTGLSDGIKIEVLNGITREDKIKIPS